MSAKPENLLAVWFGRVRQSARLMCGVPDYDAYLRHMQAAHPDQPALSHKAFFFARQDARYSRRGIARCC